MTVGKIERLPLRDVWKHEEYDFTTWLEENVDVLDDVVDLGLTGAQRRSPRGRSTSILWPRMRRVGPSS